MPTVTLFPDTLLVDCADGQVFTTSVKVAEHFGKRHDDVLKAIKKLLADCPDREFSFRNFAERIYQYSTGKNQLRDAPMYQMTEEGFAILAMGFTGPKALQWKIDFLSAFRRLEAALKAQTEREARALYFLRPHWRTIGAGLALGLSRRDIAAQTGHRSPDSISRNKARMRVAGVMAFAPAANAAA